MASAFEMTTDLGVSPRAWPTNTTWIAAKLELFLADAW
jgi:hypothetical protein